MDLKCVLTFKIYHKDVKVSFVLAYLLNDIQRAIHIQTYGDTGRHTENWYVKSLTAYLGFISSWGQFQWVLFKKNTFWWLRFSYGLQICSVFQKQFKWGIFQPYHLTNREKQEMDQDFYTKCPVVHLENWVTRVTLRGNGESQTLQC